MRKLGVPGSAQRCMPPSEWPLKDQALREQALAKGDIIDGEGALARYRPATRKFLESGYGCWLTWLDRRGELDPEASPAARATSPCVALLVEDLLQRNSTNTVIARLVGLYYVLRALDPGHDLSFVRRQIARVRARHRPARNKQARLVGADELYRLGFSLMEAVPHHSARRADAARFRNGLLVAMLAACPIRAENMRLLRLEESLVFAHGNWWIRLSPEMTKTKISFEAPLPEEMNRVIAEYRDHYRLMLLRARGPDLSPQKRAFWISLQGRPMSEIYWAIITVTRRAFGKAVNPHLFRGCATTSIAIYIPEDVGIAASLLSHASQTTSERVYNLAGSFQAAQEWQEHLLALRHQAPDSPDERT